MPEAKSIFAVALLGALATMAGCASKPPRPTAQLSRAQTLVDQAEQDGAQQFAGTDLESARTKLAMANQSADKQPDSAARLADEASADAQLASARTREGKVEQSLKEVSAGTQSLRTETDREQPGTTSTAPVVPSAPAQ